MGTDLYPDPFARAESAKAFGPSFFDRDTVRSITPDHTDQVRQMRRRNSDTIGWLYIPDTDIDQVVLKNPTGQTNNYYLNLNFNKQPDRDGSICTDRRARFGGGAREELSRNTAIYAHSRDDNPDGALFSQLKKYRDEDFARAHPYIYFSTASEDMVWEVFAVFDGVVELPYINPDLPRSEFYEMLDIVYDASLYYYDVTVAPTDKILTLSTCTYNVAGHSNLPDPNRYRFVVMARLVDPDEEVKARAELVFNSSPITPDQILELLQGGAIRRFAFGSDIL